MAMTDPKVIIALDHETDHQALEFIEKLDPATCHVKIGSILFTHYGPLLVEKNHCSRFSIIFRFEIP